MLSSFQKIALAECKRHRSEMIFGLALMAQCHVTLAQTETILNGTVPAHLKTFDVEIIINLKRAYALMIEQLEQGSFSADVTNLCELHVLVAAGEALEWGNIRGGGHEQHFTPKISLYDGRLASPISTEEPEKIRSELLAMINQFLNSGREISDGIDLFCALIRLYVFFDGNKRTSLLFTNAALVAAGIKPLLLPFDRMSEFTEAISAIFDDNTVPMRRLLLEKYDKTYGKETEV